MLVWVAFGLAVAVVLLTSLFKTIDLDSRLKALLSVVFSVAAGAVSVVIALGGDFTSTNLTEAVALIYAASQLIYNFILKGTALDSKLTSVNLFGKGKQ